MTRSTWRTEYDLKAYDYILGNNMGIVYIIECNITGEVYIGSTMISLEQRYKQHRYRYECSSRSIIERGNHMVRALEVVDTEDKTQLRIREQYWLNQYESVNQKKAYATSEERIEMMRGCQRNYLKNNREKLAKKTSAWRERNPDKQHSMDQRRNKRKSEWRKSWGGDPRTSGPNLLDIDPSIFD